MITDFFKTAINLKKIQRQGWIDKLSMNNPESVADHSYSMAIMGMILSDLENYNTEKILKMTLLHDLAESITGDFTPEQILSEEKIKLENSTFEKIIEKLPNIIKMEYEKIWKEYQEGTSDESRLVHQIDKLEMALQAKTYEEEGYSREQISSFLETAEKDIVEPKLKELFRKIIEGE
ncbi:MAG: HD domain-containing protein [Nitrosopumilus sp.]